MADKNEHLCARCAGMGGTCCQKAQVFLTLGDIGRIEGIVPDRDFFEYAAPIEEDCGPDFEIDPLWARIFDSAMRRRVIAHTKGGDCHFLTPKGCRLPEESRPLVCRLYPYDYTEATIKGVNGHLCPAPERDNPALLLALLGMNRDTADACRRALYHEIREEFPD